MASATAELVPGQLDPTIPDFELLDQTSWMLPGDDGHDSIAPDAFDYFGDQPFGLGGDLWPTELSSTTRSSELPQADDSLYNTNFGFQPSYHPTPGSDPTTSETASPQPFSTPHFPSPGLSESWQSPSKQQSTAASSSHLKPSMINDCDEYVDYDDDDDDGNDDEDDYHHNHHHQEDGRFVRRRKNRLAARKCRRAKKKTDAELIAREFKLRETHNNLTAVELLLRSQVIDLKNMILKHAKCDSEYISKYIDRESAKFQRTEC